MRMLFEFWDVWATAFCYAMLGASALLRLNHLDWSWESRVLFEKVALVFIFLGGLAGFISPIVGVYTRPAIYELLSLIAMAAFSVNLTGPLWRELIPGMDRRGPTRAERPTPLPLRGVLIDAPDEEEDRACSL